MPRVTWTGVVALLVLGVACGPPTLVEGPRVSSSLARPAQAVQLHLRAVDAAATELLSYQWSQEPASPAGHFSSTSARAPLWTPPAVTQPSTFTLRVIVVDRLGQRTQGVVQVRVSPLDEAESNRPPDLVQAPVADPPAVRAVPPGAPRLRSWILGGAAND